MLLQHRTMHCTALHKAQHYLPLLETTHPFPLINPSHPFPFIPALSSALFQTSDGKIGSIRPFRQLLDDVRFCPARSSPTGNSVSCDGRLVIFGAQVRCKPDCLKSSTLCTYLSILLGMMIVINVIRYDTSSRSRRTWSSRTLS